MAESRNTVNERTDGSRLILGIHRGSRMLTDLKAINSAAAEYDYEQYSKGSQLNNTELALMISMGIPSEFIHELSKQGLTAWDIDFVRILYAILPDTAFIRTKVLQQEQFVYEDVLYEAIETAAVRKHPEFAEILDGRMQLGRLQEMADLRIEYMKLRNEELKAEITARKEREQLVEESNTLDLEALMQECDALKKACTEKDRELRELKKYESDLRSDIDGLAERKDSAEEELEAARKKCRRLEEVNLGLSARLEEMGSLKDALNSLMHQDDPMTYAAVIGELKKQIEEGIASITGQIESVRSASEKNASDILNAISEFEETGTRRGFWGWFCKGTPEKMRNKQKKEDSQNWWDEWDPERDRFVRDVLTDTAFTSEQYKMLLYCMEEGLPMTDARVIADTKADADRMEFLIKWYFKKNGMSYRYQREQDISGNSSKAASGNDTNADGDPGEEVREKQEGQHKNEKISEQEEEGTREPDGKKDVQQDGERSEEAGAKYSETEDTEKSETRYGKKLETGPVNRPGSKRSGQGGSSHLEFPVKEGDI